MLAWNVNLLVMPCFKQFFVRGFGVFGEHFLSLSNMSRLGSSPRMRNPKTYPFITKTRRTHSGKKQRLILRNRTIKVHSTAHSTSYVFFHCIEHWLASPTIRWNVIVLRAKSFMITEFSELSSNCEPIVAQSLIIIARIKISTNSKKSRVQDKTFH